MKQLLVYMKGYAKESVLGPLFKLLEASFELLVPLVMAAIIDTGVAGADRGYILRMGGVLLLLGLVGLAAAITAQYFPQRPPWALPGGCATPCLKRSKAFPIRSLTRSAHPP